MLLQSRWFYHGLLSLEDRSTLIDGAVLWHWQVFSPAAQNRRHGHRHNLRSFSATPKLHTLPLRLRRCTQPPLALSRNTGLTRTPPPALERRVSAPRSRVAVCPHPHPCCPSRAAPDAQRAALTTSRAQLRPRCRRGDACAIAPVRLTKSRGAVAIAHPCVARDHRGRRRRPACNPLERHDSPACRDTRPRRLLSPATRGRASRVLRAAASVPDPFLETRAHGPCPTRHLRRRRRRVAGHMRTLGRPRGRAPPPTRAHAHFCCSSPAAGLETSARVEHTSESPAGDAASEIAPAPICPPQTSARVRRARRPFSARGIRTPALGTSAGAVQGDSARSVAVRARENNARSRCGLRPPCSVCRSGGFSRATSASVPRLVAAAFPGPLPPDAAAACPRRPPYAVPSRQTRLPRPARPAAPIQKRAAPTSRRRIKAGARARACLLVTGPSVRGRAEWTARVPSRCETSLSLLRCLSVACPRRPPADNSRPPHTATDPAVHRVGVR